MVAVECADQAPLEGRPVDHYPVTAHIMRSIVAAYDAQGFVAEVLGEA
jgi:hypothetical protein